MSDRHHDDDLGGRLPLVPLDDYDDEQRALYRRLVATRIRRGSRSGYRAALEDGRVIGPFNPLLRAPDVGAAYLGWAESLSASGLAAGVREIAILTVGVECGAAFVVHAHRAAAMTAGLGREDVDAVVGREPPSGLSSDEQLAHRLALALVRDRAVDDDLYAAVLGAFGERDTVVLTLLIGQYLTTSALLTCFAVPAPTAG